MRKVTTDYLRKNLLMIHSEDYIEKIQDKVEERFGCRLPKIMIRIPLNFFLKNIVLALMRGDEVHIKGYMHWRVNEQAFRRVLAAKFGGENTPSEDTSPS